MAEARIVNVEALHVIEDKSNKVTTTPQNVCNNKPNQKLKSPSAELGHLEEDNKGKTG